MLTLPAHTYLPTIHHRGILAGHDFTRAHLGVAHAVSEFAVRHGLTLYLTQVQVKRVDVQGNEIPPCCPSWYFFKPNADGSMHANEEKAPGVVATVNAMPMKSYSLAA